MNYLEAKSELTGRTPKISLKLIAIEAVALLAVAGLLVLLFT